jgi:glycosyltransferase involved in cell wall biosynthesis
MDPTIGAGVRSIKILGLMAKKCGLPVTLFALSNKDYERNVGGIQEKAIRKSFPFTLLNSGFVCMFPFGISRQLKSMISPLLAEPSVLVFETPFLGYALMQNVELPMGSLKIYNAHNVESEYWKHILGRRGTRWLLRRIAHIERTVAQNADYIFVTSADDARAFETQYNISPEKILLVPNGVDIEEVRPMEESEKVRHKLRISAEYEKFVVFMGSNVKANIDAANWIVETLALALKSVCFLIIGSVCESFKNPPENVKQMGVLENQEKNYCLGLADAAINPVLTGAGTNIKMLEYLSAGLPTITTPIGARGLSLEDGVHVLICDRENFADRLVEILNDPERRAQLSENARQRIKEFDWNKIMSGKLEEIIV